MSKKIAFLGYMAGPKKKFPGKGQNNNIMLTDLMMDGSGNGEFSYTYILKGST